MDYREIAIIAKTDELGEPDYILESLENPCHHLALDALVCPKIANAYAFSHAHLPNGSPGSSDSTLQLDRQGTEKRSSHKHVKLAELF
jgi:hypothetical protein